VVAGLAVVAGDVRPHPQPATALVPKPFRAVRVTRTDSYVRVVLRARRPTDVPGLAVLKAQRLGLSPVVMMYEPRR